MLHNLMNGMAVVNENMPNTLIQKWGHMKIFWWKIMAQLYPLYAMRFCHIVVLNGISPPWQLPFFSSTLHESTMAELSWTWNRIPNLAAAYVPICDNRVLTHAVIGALTPHSAIIRIRESSDTTNRSWAVFIVASVVRAKWQLAVNGSHLGCPARPVAE